MSVEQTTRRNLQGYRHLPGCEILVDDLFSTCETCVRGGSDMLVE